MPYSIEAEFRANVSPGTVANISQANVLLRITQADLKIQTDLSQIIDFTAIVVTPTFLNVLSQYKVAELCLVYMYGRKRKVDEVSDIDYWIYEYKNLLKKIIGGEVLLEDGSSPAVSISKGKQTFTNTAKSGIEPAMGSGDWGEFKTKDDLLDERPTD